MYVTPALLGPRRGRIVPNPGDGLRAAAKLSSDIGRHLPERPFELRNSLDTKAESVAVCTRGRS